MRNKGLAIIACTMFITNLYGCAGRGTSYVKPSLAEFKTIRNLAVTVDGNPEFSHIGAITNESVMLTILFTPILDAVIRKGMDDKTAESIKPKEIVSNYQTMFIGALVENLEELKHLERFDSVSVIDNIHDQYKNNLDGIVSFKIINWGTRIKQSGSDRIIPFMDVQISMIRTFDRKLVWRENRTVTFDANRTLEDYKQQQGLFESDFTALINKAAKEVTALLIDP